MHSRNLWPDVLADPGFGLYVHWPFCQAKCPYCDFNSHVVSSVDPSRWIAAYRSELSRFAEITGGRRLDSIFFGGGTPSLMDPSVVEAVIDAAQRLWKFSNDIEITLEANPTSVEAGRFVGFRSAGVNRVSVGVQALNDPDLKALGRLHSVAEARAALDVATAIFERTSFDLIYARQHQSLLEWEQELAQALDIIGEHVSLYQLTVESGTAFGDRLKRGSLGGLPDEDLQADMYELTQDICEAAGLPSYETSNHARPGAESRHNLIYWRGGDWLGLGPGAHGRIIIDGIRHTTDAPRAPSVWLKSVENFDAARELTSVMDSTAVAEEYLMMSLRLVEGSDLARLGALDYTPRVDSVLGLGLAEIAEGRLRLTKKGRPLLNAVLREIMVG